MLQQGSAAVLHWNAAGNQTYAAMDWTLATLLIHSIRSASDLSHDIDHKTVTAASHHIEHQKEILKTCVTKVYTQYISEFQR